MASKVLREFKGKDFSKSHIRARECTIVLRKVSKADQLKKKRCVLMPGAIFGVDGSISTTVQEIPVSIDTIDTIDNADYSALDSSDAMYEFDAADIRDVMTSSVTGRKSHGANVKKYASHPLFQPLAKILSIELVKSLTIQFPKIESYAGTSTYDLIYNKTDYEARLLGLTILGMMMMMADVAAARDTATILVLCGVVVKLIKELSTHDSPKIQLETMKILCSICSMPRGELRTPLPDGKSESKGIVERGEELPLVDCVEAVVRSGGIPIIMTHFFGDDEKISGQAAWVLSNVALEWRYKMNLMATIMEQGSIIERLDLLTQEHSVENLLLLIKNLLSGKRYSSTSSDETNYKKQLKFDKEAFDVLIPCFKLYHKNEKILSLVIKGLRYLAAEDKLAEMIMDDPAVPIKIVQLCAAASSTSDATTTTAEIAIDALILLGNLTSSSDNTIVDRLIEYGAMPCWINFLFSPDTALRGEFKRKTALWALSNVAAGTKEQIGIVLRTSGVFKKILSSVRRDTEGCTTNACYVLKSISDGATSIQMKEAIKAGTLAEISYVLAGSNARAICCCLYFLNKVLPPYLSGKGYARLTRPIVGVDKEFEEFESLGGWGSIDLLSSSENRDISDLVEKIREHKDLIDQLEDDDASTTASSSSSSSSSSSDSTFNFMGSTDLSSMSQPFSF